MEVILMGKLKEEKGWQQFKDGIEKNFDKKKALGIKWKNWTLEICPFPHKLRYMKDFLIQLNSNTFKAWCKEDRLVVHVQNPTMDFKKGELIILTEGECEKRRKKLWNEKIIYLMTNLVIN